MKVEISDERYMQMEELANDLGANCNDFLDDAINVHLKRCKALSNIFERAQAFSDEDKIDFSKVEVKKIWELTPEQREEVGDESPLVVIQKRPDGSEKLIPFNQDLIAQQLMRASSKNAVNKERLIEEFLRALDAGELDDGGF